MKILFVNMHMNIGGIKKSLLNLLDMLKDQKDVAVDLLVMIGDRNTIEDEIKDLGVSNLFICRNMNVFYKGLRNQTNLTDLIKKIFWTLCSRVFGREWVIHYIIRHSPQYGGYDVVISYTNGIWTRGEKYFSGGCEFYTLDRVDAKKKLAWIHSNPINLGFTKEICERVYSDFDAIVNVSNGCRMIFGNICPSLNYKSKVFYNLCNIDVIREQAKEFNPYQGYNQFRLVTVCRIDNEAKRLDRAIDVALILKNTYNLNFHWTVVGDGKDKDYILNMLKEKKVAELFTFVGSKNNPYPYVENADVFILTSDYEAFSITVKEAQLLGVPVIVTPISSATELITDGIDGYIADFTAESIAEKVNGLLNEPEQLQRIKDALRNNGEMENYRSFVQLINGQV